jgi:hypothetical protein
MTPSSCVGDAVLGERKNCVQVMFSQKRLSWHQYLIPVIPATWEAEI